MDGLFWGVWQCMVLCQDSIMIHSSQAFFERFFIYFTLKHTVLLVGVRCGQVNAIQLDVTPRLTVFLSHSAHSSLVPLLA